MDTFLFIIANHGATLDDETLIHSDQGCHYTSKKFREIVKDSNLRQSMSRRGNCWDNAPQESFFGHMKDHIMDKIATAESFEEAKAIIDDYMDFYNNDNGIWELAKLTPNEYYHYVLYCIGGKWKMTILHEIYTYGKIRFNQTLKVLPISEKVLSQQLKELVQDGLVQRVVNGDACPPSIDYILTTEGYRLIPALDVLYIWAIRQMDAKEIPIDADAFVVHQSERYVEALKDIMEANDFWPDARRGDYRRKGGAAASD